MPPPPKPVVTALRGRRVDPPPTWLMRQAGRYLPEYLAVREAAGSFLDLCFDPPRAAEVTLQPVRRFGLDAAILFSDILVVPHALGQKVEFDPGPRTVPVRTGGDIARLSPDRLHETLAPVYETLERVSQALSGDVALIGFAGAPWTVATYMVEGGTSRDHAAVRAWALDEAGDFGKLVDLLVECTADHLVRQAAAGAEALQIFDSWAGALPWHAFEKLSLAPVREIARRVKRSCPDVPVIAFPRGAGPRIADFAAVEEIDAVGADHAADPRWLAEEIQPRAAVQGNLDPALLLVGGRQMTDRARETVDALSAAPHVFNLGHGILPSTPVAHVAELVRAVRER